MQAFYHLCGREGLAALLLRRGTPAPLAVAEAWLVFTGTQVRASPPLRARAVWHGLRSCD